ncbi:MAG TPA: hypothetical protein VK963_02810, partial [Candidatus Saccharimonadales bacterium]|nr:hypothetical protein [Candidatus Saccharimonadales bacterium]
SSNVGGGSGHQVTPLGGMAAPIVVAAQKLAEVGGSLPRAGASLLALGLNAVGALGGAIHSIRKKELNLLSLS